MRHHHSCKSWQSTAIRICATDGDFPATCETGLRRVCESKVVVRLHLGQNLVLYAGQHRTKTSNLEILAIKTYSNKFLPSSSMPTWRPYMRNSLPRRHRRFVGVVECIPVTHEFQLMITYGLGLPTAIIAWLGTTVSLLRLLWLFSVRIKSQQSLHRYE